MKGVSCGIDLPLTDWLKARRDCLNISYSHIWVIAKGLEACTTAYVDLGDHVMV
jgi:hypothetical protein